MQGLKISNGRDEKKVTEKRKKDSSTTEMYSIQFSGFRSILEY